MSEPNIIEGGRIEDGRETVLLDRREMTQSTIHTRAELLGMMKQEQNLKTYNHCFGGVKS
jgi:hypothetical protein